MIDKYTKNLSDKLNEACRKNGEKQNRIAEKSGVSTRELRRIMKGHVRDVRLSTFIQVAQAIGVSVEDGSVKKFVSMGKNTSFLVRISI